MFLSMVKNGSARLNANKGTVNDLNVFPIPDGDTGDNMHMTINSGCAAASGYSIEGIAEVSKAVSNGMLLGARGNSGVILSRIFAGMAKGLAKHKEANLKNFAAAMESGVKEAYNSVSSPVEGTILTVLKDSVKAASKYNEENGFEGYFKLLVNEAQAALDRTPEQLPVLKEAGVVDSGGAGLLCILQGMEAALSGESLEEKTEERNAVKATNLDSFTEDSELEFGYCTEFLLRLQNAKVEVSSFDEKVIKDYLNEVGDSIVCFRDGSIVKVHVHTKTPGEILNHCQKYGEYLTVKIENMTVQHHETHIQNNFNVKRKPVGIVAVASGNGIVNSFKEAGADFVIQGGQTMNPSAKDFIDAFEKVNTDDIFVFPNNSNVILAAKQAAELYEGSKIHVIPSRSIGAGYVAVAALDKSSKDIAELEGNAVQAINSVITGEVSRASRNTVKDGVTVRNGDFIAYSSGKILADSPSAETAAIELCDRLGVKGHDVVLVFYGVNASSLDAAELVTNLENKYPGTEFILTNGGQPVCDYTLVLC